MKFKLFLFGILFSLFNCNAQKLPLYVGTYTNGDSQGIYKLQFNTATGELSDKQLAVAIENPSFISFSPNKKFLYAVGEGNSGLVTAFSVKADGKLEFINSVSSEGNGPCHVSVNATGNKAVVSNYGGGIMALYNINKDGSLNKADQTFDYNLPEKVSHAHSAQFFNDNLFVADLGINVVYQYKLDTDTNTYKLISPSIVDIPEKSGPRHFTLTKDGHFIYIINELASTIISAKKVNDHFELLENISTLDKNFKGDSFCADIHLSKDEQFLYGSNRGENSIAVFKRNKTDGTIEKIQNIPVHGDWPRNFTLDPTGKFMLVANKKSNNISVFKIDTNTGKLTFLHSVEAPSPVCLLF